MQSRPDKYTPIDESQFVQAEVYDPEYSAISNDEIDQELKMYANEPYYSPAYSSETMPEAVEPTDNRNFPGRSKPTDMSGAKKFATAWFMGLMSKPKDVSLNTLFELARDLNDIYKRPGKAVFGAVDGVLEAAEKPFRTNAHAVSRAVALAVLPYDMSIKSAQGFIEGLNGWRGAAEVMHRLGVKNAKEKLSPEAYKKKQLEYEEKMKKQGILGKIATSVAHDISENPLDFWSEFAEDPLLLGGAVKSGAKSLLKPLGESAVLESITLGSATRNFLKSKLGKAEYEEFIGIVNAAREKGGGGSQGFFDGLKQASEGLQTKFKELVKRNTGIGEEKAYKPITKIKIGPQKVAEEQIHAFMRDTLPDEVVKGGNETALKLMQEGKPAEALAEAILTKQSKYLKSVTEQPVMRALAEFGTYEEGRKIGTASTYVQQTLWNEMKKYGPLSETAFNDMTMKEVRKRLPQQLVRHINPQMELAALKSEPRMAEILSKTADKVTLEDVDWVFNQYAKIIPKERMGEVFKKAGMSPLGANQGMFYKPKGLGALNFMDEVLREAGLHDDFSKPMFLSNQLVDTDKQVYLEKFREALKPVNGGNDLMKLSPQKLEQLGRAAENKAEFMKLTKQEQDFLEKGFRPIMNDLHHKLDTAIISENSMRAQRGLPPIPTLGYQKNYLPHLFKTMEETGMWEAGKVYDDLVPSITSAATKARQGTLTEYPTNILEVYQTYLNGVMRFVHKRPVAQALTEKLQTMPINAEMKEFISSHLNNFVGQKIEDPIIDTMVKGFMQTPLASWMGVTENTAREKVYGMAYNLLQWGYASGMGLNFKLPVRNMFQSFLGIPNTSVKSWTTAIQDVGQLMAPASSHSIETRALNKILQNSEVYKGRVGNLGQMLPTEVSKNAAFPGRFERMMNKAIEVTGFPASEKWLFSQSMANGMRHRMNELGIKSYDALLKHSKLKDVVEYSENLATRIHFQYNKMFRPLFLNNPSGAHILQYFTFGGRMANQALRDMTLPSRHKVLLKMLFQQSLLATTLTMGGLSGAGYAAYFSAVDPLKQLLQIGGPDTAKAVKSPALKGAYGLAQGAVGGLTGSKRLQSRGWTQVKQSVTPAAYKITKEAFDFKDPSRMFLYRKYPERKKKR